MQQNSSQSIFSQWKEIFSTLKELFSMIEKPTIDFAEDILPVVGDHNSAA